MLVYTCSKLCTSRCESDRLHKSKDKVDKINCGDNCIKDIRNVLLREVGETITLYATTDFLRINECDALLICLLAPLDKFHKPDMRKIESAGIAIGQNMKLRTFISLESTIYPTTPEDFMMPIIDRESGLRHGRDFWFAYSPERVDPGNENFQTKNTPKVLGSVTTEGLKIGNYIYPKALIIFIW
jgi:UDP-N-acetyl-D-glucosamine dehydrogenase